MVSVRQSPRWQRARQRGASFVALVLLSPASSLSCVPRSSTLTRELCFEQISNVRCLSSVQGAAIKPGRLWRTGFPSKATANDVQLFLQEIGIRTMVDLRSDEELFMDESLKSNLYEGFEDIFWPGKTASAAAAAVAVAEAAAGAAAAAAEAAAATATETETAAAKETSATAAAVSAAVLSAPANSSTTCAAAAATTAEAVLEAGDCAAPPSPAPPRRLRYFVSLVNESIIKRGIFWRLRKLHKAAVLLWAGAGVLSRRARHRARAILLREMNGGGLVLFNELLLEESGAGLAHVLTLMATPERLPLALFCTAGKDRTGLAVALALAALGVPDDAILDDYSRSENAYAALEMRAEMVVALQEHGLDPDVFLGAPRAVMADTLRGIRDRHGSVEAYLDVIGFDAAWRRRLRVALCDD